MSTANVDWIGLKAIARQREQEAITAFVDAVQDTSASLEHALNALEMTGTWVKAMLAVARAPTLTDEARLQFLECWLTHGNSIRGHVNDDLVLIQGLRALLPRHQGRRTFILYRGDSAFNRQRRSYGLSWSTSADTARSFANGLWSTFNGGAVVLRACVPASAIICAPVKFGGDRYAEKEYLVDRRRLGRVTIIERIPQRSFEERRAEMIRNDG